MSPAASGNGGRRRPAGAARPTRRHGSTQPRRTAGTGPRRRKHGEPATPGRWVPAIGAASILGVLVVASLGGDSGASSSATTAAVPVTSIVDDEPASTQANVVTGSTDAPIVKTNLSKTIYKGYGGNEVKLIQQRLADLKFAPGPIDGIFGSNTQQAVWAYKKLVDKVPRQELANSDSASTITNEMWQRMQDPIVIQPRIEQPAGRTHVEIYVPEQVMIVFTDNTPTLITHISTGEQLADGTPDTFCEEVTYDSDPTNGEPLPEPITKGICAETKTPGGVFSIYREVAGKREGPLGGMMHPVYFNYGIAIHGADNVPLYPASHGCVRINQTIATYFQSLVGRGDKVYVWAQDGKHPSKYDKYESAPSWNRDDPNYTTTSTTSTTSTTLPPAVPVSTVPPPSTTTRSTVAATTTVRTTVPSAPTSAPDAPPPGP